VLSQTRSAPLVVRSCRDTRKSLTLFVHLRGLFVGWRGGWLAHDQGALSISTPYLDAGGAGVVVTMSKIVYSGSAPHQEDDQFVAVAGMDFVLGKFYSMIKTYTGCVDGLLDANNRQVTCFVMDESGCVTWRHGACLFALVHVYGISRRRCLFPATLLSTPSSSHNSCTCDTFRLVAPFGNHALACAASHSRL